MIRFLGNTNNSAGINTHSCGEAGSKRPDSIPMIPLSGRNYYPNLKSNKTGLIALVMIVGGLVGTIGVSMLWIALFAGWIR